MRLTPNFGVSAALRGVAALLILSEIVAACDRPQVPAVETSEKPAPVEALGEKLDPSLNGVTSWTQFRGDFTNSGESFSPRPSYKGEKWRFFTAGPISGSPVVKDGVVYAATELGHVHAVSIETGKKVWSKTLGSVGPGQGVVFSSPLILGNMLILASKAGNVHALRLDDGEELWRYQCNGDEGRPIFASPKGTEDGVVFATLEPKVHCIDPKTGARKWVLDLLRETGSSAALLDGAALIAGKDRVLHEIDMKSGKERRRIPIAGSSHCTPTIGMGYAFLIVGGRKSIGVDLLTEEQAWENLATGDDKQSLGFKDGVVFLPLGQYMWAINGVTGEKLWEAKAEHKVSPPCVNGDDVVFVAQDGWLRVVDRRTGELKESLNLDLKLFSGPVIVDRRVFLGTLSDYLVCVE